MAHRMCQTTHVSRDLMKSPQISSAFRGKKCYFQLEPGISVATTPTRKAPLRWAHFRGKPWVTARVRHHLTSDSPSVRPFESPGLNFKVLGRQLAFAKPKKTNLEVLNRLRQFAQNYGDEVSGLAALLWLADTFHTPELSKGKKLQRPAKQHQQQAPAEMPSKMCPSRQRTSNPQWIFAPVCLTRCIMLTWQPFNTMKLDMYKSRFQGSRVEYLGPKVLAFLA